MKNLRKISFYLFATISILIVSCKEQPQPKAVEVAVAPQTPVSTINNEKIKYSDAFKAYWFAGEAELAAYKLDQARYGEMRDGEAVLVFVTEDFLPKEQVKADKYSKENIPVLKVNFTKKFNTGVYPYSIINSIFYPVNNKNHAIKLAFASQEWCGHVYTQLNNRGDFNLTSHSYFEGEADQDFSLSQNILEDELWAQLRINPISLPQGTITLIPALEFSRLHHKAVEAHQAVAELAVNGEESTYTITYSDIERILKIKFQTAFPHQILGWEETGKSGFGDNAKTLTTTATLIKTIKSAYWSKNHNSDAGLRKTLGLK
ncbi:MAG: septum formation inhibitor Maf [Flavobacteriaceae bacterium]|nr:septum formation inhibitor Maf [Flavobacteriaceae bacterium]MDZ4148313.1 septum formation inhibitor Maf [Flavobacteriaceae bacterium]